jgi:hypothetical protein
MLLRVYKTQILNIEVAKTDEVVGYEKMIMCDDWESCRKKQSRDLHEGTAATFSTKL